MIPHRGLAHLRQQAHARLTAAFTEGERRVREDMASTLRQLADEIQTMPLPKVRLIAALLRQLRGVKHGEAPES